MSIPLRLSLIMSYSKILRVCLFNQIALHSFIYFGQVGHTLIHCQFPKELLPSAFHPPYNLFYHYPHSWSFVNEKIEITYLNESEMFNSNTSRLVIFLPPKHPQKLLRLSKLIYSLYSCLFDMMFFSEIRFHHTGAIKLL